MDERKEILQDTIDRLIETALQELDQKLPEAGGEWNLRAGNSCLKLAGRLLSPTSATRSDRTHSWMNSTAN